MGRRWGLDFDEEQIRRLLRNITPRSRLFQVVKQELQAGRPGGSSCRAGAVSSEHSPDPGIKP
jgi:hypothetical protein